MRYVCLLMVWLSSIGAARMAQAYPSFIAYGYTSCAVCHFNPFGNGPLTDYGRALGATVISGKPLFGGDLSDEQIAARSGFLGGTPMPRWIRPSIDYRGLLLASQIGEPSTDRFRYINMQADVSVALQLLKSKLLAVVTIGYSPPPASAITQAQKDKFNRLISREHYVSYQLNKTYRLAVGLMDMVYGIRVPDHIAFSREQTSTAENDQTHGVVLHMGTKKFEGGAQIYVGNLLQQDSSVRLKGVAFTSEYEVAEKTRLGASLAINANSFRSRVMGAGHIRVGAGEGGSILAEMGMVRDAPDNGDPNKLGGYIFFQSLSRIARGFHLLITGEAFTDRIFEPADRYLRVGPSIQWFPQQRIELRSDFLGTRRIGQGNVQKDSFVWLNQVHLWF